MKGIIVYKGRYGATRQYANWLGTELHVPVIEAEEISAEELALYDYIIVGGSVYVGKLQVRDWLRKYTPFLETKKLFFFIVCGTPAAEKEKVAEIIQNNIPASLRNEKNVYLLPGRLVKKALSMFDRFTLRVGAFFEKDPVTKKAMLQDYDSVKPEHLNALVKNVHAFMPESTAVTAV